MASGPGVDWRVGLVDPTTGVPVTGFPSTVADGANVVEGATTDAAVGDASGTLNAHLRQTAKALAGGLPAALVGGRLSVDGSGVTQPTSAASGQFVDGAITTLGTNADAAVGDATGTLNAHLRQVAKSLAGTLTMTGADTTATGSLAAGNAATTLSTVGMAAATFQIATDASWNGTLTFEVSNDNSIWNPVDAVNLSTGLRGPTYTTANTNAIFRVVASGLAKTRVRASTYVAGTATINAEAGVGAAQYGQFVQGSQFAGATVAQSPVIVGMNGSAGIRYLTEANAVFPTTGNAVLGVGPGVWDLTNWQKTLGDTSGRAIVVGAAAAGAAVAGNPLVIGGSDASGNAQFIKSGVTNSDSQATQTSLAALAQSHLFGGGTWERQRNNVNVVVQASTLTTAQTINTDITTYNARSIMVHANVSIYNGGSINMKLQWKDANGLFVDIPGATTGTLSTGADLILALGPTVWPANTATAFYVNYFLPRLVRLVTVIATASVTFSQSYDLPAS